MKTKLVLMSIVTALLFSSVPSVAQTTAQLKLKLQNEMKQCQTQMADCLGRIKLEEPVLQEVRRLKNNQQLQCDSYLKKYKAMKDVYPDDPSRWKNFEGSYSTCLKNLSKLNNQEQRSMNIIKHENEMYRLLQIQHDKAKVALAKLQ